MIKLSRSTQITLLVITILAVIVPGVVSAKRTLWRDEAYTAAILEFSPASIVSRTSKDVHPPLYYLVTKPIVWVFGNSELALRVGSIVCMLGSLLIFWLILRRFYDQKAPFWIVAVASLGAYAARYGEEARMYALAALLYAASTYVLHYIFENDKKLRPKLVYGLLIAGLFYTHYFAVLAVVIHVVFAFYRLRIVNKLSYLVIFKKLFSYFVVPALTFLALVAAWLPILLKQNDGVQAGYWIGPVTPDTYIDTISQLFYFRGADFLKLSYFVPLIILVACIVATFMVSAKLKRAPNRHFFMFAGLSIILPALVLTLLSLPPRQPVYNARYFANFAGALYIALGYLVSKASVTYRSTQNKIHRLGMGASILVVVATLAYGYISTIQLSMSQAGGRKLMSYVAEHAQPGDLVIVEPIYALYETYYYAPAGLKPVYYNTHPPTDYHEEVLIYDNQARSTTDLESLAGRVWYISLNDTFSASPENWMADCGSSRSVDLAVQCFSVRK